MGVTHVLNAAHGTAYSHGGQDFYGATIDYYGVPAHDLPTFDISQFFFSAAQFIHNALNTPGGTKLSSACSYASQQPLATGQLHELRGGQVAMCSPASCWSPALWVPGGRSAGHVGVAPARSQKVDVRKGVNSAGESARQSREKKVWKERLVQKGRSKPTHLKWTPSFETLLWRLCL